MFKGSNQESELSQAPSFIMTIKNIVFDLGNVLIEYEPRRIVGEVFDDPDEVDLIVGAVFESPGWKQLDRGVISFEQHQELLISKFPDYEDEITWLLAHWHESPRIILGMPEIIRNLYSAGYDLYLLSNANSRYDAFAPEIDSLKFFKGITISAELHLLKPEPEIYDRFCEIHDLIPGECVFIDDMVENVEGAIRCGWHAYCFKDAASLAIDLERLLKP